MRGNIIEELYYGNIDPQDRGYHPQSPVKKVSDSLNDLEEKLTGQLAGENKALFLRFCNVYAEFMGESELDTFITGFRLGARFMMDTFLSDDAPFESLECFWLSKSLCSNRYNRVGYRYMHPCMLTR